MNQSGQKWEYEMLKYKELKTHSNGYKARDKIQVVASEGNIYKYWEQYTYFINILEKSEHFDNKLLTLPPPRRQSRRMGSCCASLHLSPPLVYQGVPWTSKAIIKSWYLKEKEKNSTYIFHLLTSTAGFQINWWRWVWQGG